MDEDQIQVEEADARAEKAKASLRSRLHELERRYKDKKEQLDVRARVREYPRASVGIAVGVGLLAGFLQGPRKRGPAAANDGKPTLGSTVIAALGALAIQALKEAALDEGREIAKGWWNRPERDVRDAPRDLNEPFLEH